MDFSSTMAVQDKARVQVQVDAFNAALGNGRVAKQVMDKDDFLKILITQLAHQDPTQPMEDKEFIAQMAQFSTLEQMTNMGAEFTKLSGILKSGQAFSLLGKTVEIISREEVISGVVSEIAGREYPRVLVNGRYFDIEDIEKVRE